MHLRAFLTAFGIFTGVATARYYSVAAPKTIKPGEPFDAILIGDTIYIQSVYDVAVAFGIGPEKEYPKSLGIVLDSFYLGPEQSNKRQNITYSLTVPEDTFVKEGNASLRMSLFSLWGAIRYPDTNSWTVPVELGNATSEEYIRGDRVLNG